MHEGSRNSSCYISSNYGSNDYNNKDGLQFGIRFVKGRMDISSFFESLLQISVKRILGGALILLFAVILVVLSQKN